MKNGHVHFVKLGEGRKTACGKVMPMDKTKFSYDSKLATCPLCFKAVFPLVSERNKSHHKGIQNKVLSGILKEIISKQFETIGIALRSEVVNVSDVKAVFKKHGIELPIEEPKF